MQIIEKYSMYKRCICEISMCIIKFKQFKMLSLFQHNHVISIYHLQHHGAVNWCCWVVGFFCVCFFFFTSLQRNVSALSFSQDRWMQDYLRDFRQRLDRRADALSGRVREKHGRHRQGKCG